MLMTFTTDVYADTMFGNDALTMLKMMEYSATVPGAILAADVPQAPSRLTAALNAQKEVSPAKDTDEPAVSMVNRGLPLIELLTAVAKAGCDVMWK
ncbi:DUF1840 domain-containing protein [Nitrosomonas sp. Nm33]|uniref:DUF1840 domain-containing protein n=1 Tax=Nitrosomonas sp. Nm33 TaxID=133724 RepID=UPI000899EA58|nr:DUF1840 domain-containing protein [Nitrosomonas sp. Nm33]SDX89598.1 protein of unknown function [Nitrosomonas sp. Nm33]